MKDKVADKIVLHVLDELGGRKGFDYWYGNIDDDIQDEIKDALREIVSHHLIECRNDELARIYTAFSSVRGNIKSKEEALQLIILIKGE